MSKKLYETEVVKKLMDEFGYKSVMAVPKLEKIVVNVGWGEAITDPDSLDVVVDEITLMTGQRAVKTYAKKSISNFKIRKGQAIGAKVTLRKILMYNFLDVLIHIALPRTKDFNGVSTKGFDGRGNFSFSIKEQVVFPSIKYDMIKQIHGLDVTIVTTARTDVEAYKLLKYLGFPFKEKD
ncbi:MAG: 50S ribosomal protein L5 [Spirochaetia bacterium]|nr:50S ribosomal protein L5 [Spirochaetota bacterium]MCX8096136.1 50S ribosomal protein L5 [Spirochaetota bacterium]MDW8112381.1 50S ribosomal protein L5 [Spirochaetia bacterium]